MNVKIVCKEWREVMRSDSSYMYLMLFMWALSKPASRNMKIYGVVQSIMPAPESGWEYIMRNIMSKMMLRSRRIRQIRDRILDWDVQNVPPDPSLEVEILLALTNAWV